MDLGESSTSFRIHCLEFYFPRHSVASPCRPLLSPFLSFSFFRVILFLFLPSRLTLSLLSRGSLCRASARFYPVFTDWRHFSWMDRQSSFAPCPSAFLHTLTSRRLGCSTPSPVPIRPLDGRLRVSEFTHSRKVRASRRHFFARLTLHSLTLQCLLSRVNYSRKKDIPI